MTANERGGRPTGNQFLDALPPDARRRCGERARLVTLPAGEAIAQRGDRADTVLFPLHGAVSEVEEGRDGGSVEVTAVGYEGLSPVEALLDADAEQFRRIIQVPTAALAVPLGALRQLRDADASLHGLVHRYAAARLRAAGITIGCNARHEAPARLARWLLRMSDRAREADFELTHETIALMLGVRRATVTRAIALLAEASAISAGRHSVRIVDRPVLETLTCSCYPDSSRVFSELYRTGYRTTEI